MTITKLNSKFKEIENIKELYITKNCKNLAKIVTCVLSMNFDTVPYYIDSVITGFSKAKLEYGISILFKLKEDYEIECNCFNSEKIEASIFNKDFIFKTDSIEKLILKYIELTK